MIPVAKNEDDLSLIQPEHDFFIGIDSDGTAFDVMDLKQNECFTPSTINNWQLQAACVAAREVCTFVNLRSKWRGLNRWRNIARTLDLIAAHPDVIRRGVQVPSHEAVRTFMGSGVTLCDSGLREYRKKQDTPDLQAAQRWSAEINENVERIVHGVMPFPNVPKALQILSSQADLLCVSTTRGQDIAREWNAGGILPFLRMVSGQEGGSKEKALRNASAEKYLPDHRLMIGDAMGDLEAAHTAGVLFYPMIPGNETASWDRFLDEGLQKFIKGTYAGAYEAERIREFERWLPTVPPWQV